MERIEQFLQPRHEFSRVFSWSVCEVSETIDDELVIRAGGEFLFEKRSNSRPRSLSGSQLEKSDFRGEPFVSFSFETETEICVRSCVVPVVGDLTLVDPRHKLRSCDCVLAFFSPEIRNFDKFLLQCHVSVGENLLSQLCSGCLCVGIDDDILLCIVDCATITRTSGLLLIL